MDNHLENILVFATNIKTGSDKQKINDTLDTHLGIHKWSIDQEDIDCVLRIESNTLNEEQIIQLLNEYNFICKILE